MKSKNTKRFSGVNENLISQKEQDEHKSLDQTVEVEDSSTTSDDDIDQFSSFRPNGHVKVEATNVKSPSLLKEFICDYCQDSFKAKKELVRHVQSHIKFSVPWKCSICDFAAPSKKKLYLHNFDSHNISLHLKNNNHDLKEKTKNENIVSKAESTSDFNCFCGVSFNNMLSLRSHKNRLHRNKNKCMYGCKNVQYVKNSHFLRHIKAKHPEMLDQIFRMSREEKCDNNFKCDKCEFTTETKSLLKIHITSHLPYKIREKFECVLCNKFFTRASSLRVHTGTIHEKNSRFICLNCPLKAFKKRSQLNDHIALNHTKDHKCNLCNCHFLNQLMLNCHQRLAHKKDSVLKAQFQSLKVKKKPRRSEKLLKTFHCPEPGCSRAFTLRYNLIRHQKTKGHLQLEVRR